MKIKIFLLILFFSTIFKINFSYADEEKMKKGLEIFNETGGCAACHVLKAARSKGNIGPNLDIVSNLTIESVKDIITYGRGVMPAFGEGEILTKEEIDIVSFYVISSAGK